MEGAQFHLEARRRPLLLASISQASSSDKGGSKVTAKLPDAKGQGAPTASAVAASTPPEKQQARRHRLRAPDLGRASAEVHRAVAVAGGVLVAAISQAAQRVAAARPGRGSNALPFYQSFKLPWNANARSGSRRYAAAAAAGGWRAVAGMRRRPARMQGPRGPAQQLSCTASKPQH